MAISASEEQAVVKIIDDCFFSVTYQEVVWCRATLAIRQQDFAPHPSYDAAEHHAR